MDSGTVIIAAVLLAIALLPFVMLGKKYRNQKKQLLNALTTLAKKSQDKLSLFEAEGNFGIGISKGARKLYFARIIRDGITVQLTDLTEFYLCKLNTVSRNFGKGEKVTDRIELVLFHKKLGQPQVSLDLYNSELDNLTLGNELHVAIRWEQIIEDLIKEQKKKEHKYAPGKQIALA